MQDFKAEMQAILENAGAQNIKALYHQVSEAAMQAAAPVWENPAQGKTACYFSAEFLLGRMIYSNLYNLGLLDDFKDACQKNGLDPNMFEEVEDNALGNGGLGRLAACFLDSGATLGYKLDGYGIRYRYGLFKQYFQNGFQQEEADDWLRFGDPWSIRREDETITIEFGDQTVNAVPYDMPVIGFGGKTVNTLRLWQAEAVRPFNFNQFNDQNYDAAYKDQIDAEAISSVLYPNDDTIRGKKLRLKQQYFFSSASLQSILRQWGKKDFTGFAQSYAIQLNDTHPVLAIPEMLRILMEEYMLHFNEALAIVKETFAYTNHTVLPEALEKWDVSLFTEVLPNVYPYVTMLQNHLRHTLADLDIHGHEQQQYWIIHNGQIHMARMGIFATHSTNGVAALHTEILKNDALKEWYALYPERFSNKTNGITQRRWLGLCNPQLSQFITSRIGNGWLTDLDELRKLEAYANDSNSLKEFMAIKRQKKVELANHVRVNEYGAELNVDSVFDIQVKRLHEYKRQLLNAFSIVDIYFQLKDGTLKDFAPMTFLFGAKAFPGYFRAKAIIKYINEIAKMIDNDPAVNQKLKVLFVQNYKVSYAEKLIPAADISEQISTAGKEASGTGNMKLMLNGAVTLGTYDGANIEIVEQAGEENNYIFGARVEDIEKIAPTYNPMEIYQSSPRIRRVLDTLIDGTFSDGHTGMFRELYDALLSGAEWHGPDHYYLLLDFEGYVDAKLKANRDWQNGEDFARKCLMNVAGAGKFSSDRTIKEYATEIWGL